MAIYARRIFCDVVPEMLPNSTFSTAVAFDQYLVWAFLGSCIVLQMSDPDRFNLLLLWLTNVVGC